MSTPRSAREPAGQSGGHAWFDLAEDQLGVVSRAQLLELGMTPAEARSNLESGRWRRLLPGVYATHLGPILPLARVWAAVLSAGPDAVASHCTALWLSGVIDAEPARVHVAIPHARRVRSREGVKVLRTVRTADLRPVGRPPRMKVEAALLDQIALIEEGDADDVVNLVLRATQRRLTTAPRLLTALDTRDRQRWRPLLHEVLGEVKGGVASPLELRYARSVERPHGLPCGERNVREVTRGGGSVYRDVRYRPWGVVVELDGRATHPRSEAFRDHRRDNAATVDGEAVLRYGWRDVMGVPCDVATQVARLLTLRGWAEAARSCSAQCAVGAA